MRTSWVDLDKEASREIGLVLRAARIPYSTSGYIEDFIDSLDNDPLVPVLQNILSKFKERIENNF